MEPGEVSYDDVLARPVGSCIWRVIVGLDGNFVALRKIKLKRAYADSMILYEYQDDKIKELSCSRGNSKSKFFDNYFHAFAYFTRIKVRQDGTG